MKLRTLSIVVLVLAALSALAYFLQRPSPPPSADSRLGQPVIAPTAIEQTAVLRVSDQGKTVTVARQPDSSWKVTSYHDLPADFSKLSRFMGELGEAKLQRLVTSNPERIARLEFKDTKVELLDSAQKPVASITLGKHAEAGGGRYVRFADESKAYLANLNAWIDAESKNWANSQLIDVKPDDIAKVELSFPGAEPVTLSRAKKEDAWQAERTPENQRVKADRVASLLSSAGSIRFSDTTAVDDPNAVAARQHERTVKLTTFDQKTVTIALGRKPEEKKLKPPAPSTDGKSGPAALGSLSDLAKKEPASAQETSAEKTGNESKSDEPKPLAPEYDTIPAGPVFVSIRHSDSDAAVNTLMQKRAFQVYEYAFTGLPQKPEELFEPAPSVPPAPSASAPATEPAAAAAPAEPARSAAAEPKTD